MKCVVIVSSLLILSTCAQEQESTKTTDTEKPESMRAETATRGYIVIDENEEIEERHIADSNEKNEPQTQRKKFSLDIDQRNSALEELFLAADQNEDGYLELHELPKKQTGWTQGTRSFARTEITDARFLTANLEQIERDLERSGEAREQLSNIRKNLKYRFDYEFDTADANGDGRLSRDEYHNRNRRLEIREKQQYFLKLDTNQDGFVDWREYSVEIQHLRRLDENRDGHVTSKESEGNWFPS